MGTEPTATSALPWASLVGALREYAIFTLNAAGVIDSWNAGVGELLGYEEHEFVGQPANLIFTLEDRAQRAAEQEMATARQHGDARDDRWHLRKDGSRLWVNGVMHAVHDATGAVVGFIKIMRDQTEKRAAEKRLEESEERFRAAFRSNPSPLAIVERPEARIVELNDALTRAFRLGRHEALGRTPPELGLEMSAAELADVRARLARAETARVETRFRRADGEPGHGNFAFEPIELGGRPHAVMLMHDVTEWRRARDEAEQQRGLVDALLNSLPGVFYILDGSRLVRWNDEVERVTGLSAEELAGADATDLLADPERALEHIETVLRTGRTAVEAPARSKDGSLVPYLFTGQRVVLDGRPYVVGVGINISEQVQLRRSLERHALEQGAIADLAASTLANGELLATLELAARRVAETLGADHVNIVEFSDDGRPELRVGHRSPAASAAPLDDELYERLRLSGAEGASDRWSDQALAPLGIGIGSGIRFPIHGRGRVFGLIDALSGREEAFTTEDENFMRSVAFLLAAAIEQHRLNRELAHRAEHDDLTGLPTRVAFERRLVDALSRAERQGSKLAVLFLDLDRFKLINDTLGHHAGDEVLRSVARRVEGAIRSWDVVARHGGDEFVLFLPDIGSSSEVAHVTARLLEAFEAPFAVADRELSVTITIGIATFPDNGTDAESLLRAADTALYEGKARGRSSFHFFTREQDRKVTERLELEAELRQALERGEFELAYQPRIDLTSGGVSAVEALIRWHHEAHGSLPPGSFLPVAEAIGLAVPLGEWVMRRAFAHHAAWRARPGAPERVAVNVSAIHLKQPAFPEALGELLREAGLEPHDVEIEVPEGGLLRDPELVDANLRALRALGVRIVVDDFGTSASPLARLQALPIDGLKVDATFTHQLDDPHGRQLVEALVQVAMGLDIDPLAEGIETSAQDRAVRELGFRAAQGRWYCEPLEHDSLLEFLAVRAGSSD